MEIDDRVRKVYGSRQGEFGVVTGFGERGLVEVRFASGTAMCRRWALEIDWSSSQRTA